MDFDLNSANLLNLARLGLVPVFFLLAYARKGWWFVGVWVASEICGLISYFAGRGVAPSKLEESLEAVSDLAAYIAVPLSIFLLLRGWMNSYEDAAPIRITFWTTTGERPRLEMSFQGREKSRVLERCGEPDEETADWLYYQHLTFREPNERATTRPVRFLLSGDNVIHIEVGAVNPD